eukprot:CAMPEP_0202467312 /NCGR_PEP_ID=MMETSP1360-20130828/71578_1 /ASSEMBLY_ACC=CAM_ASM_000848 /TAXON_ID=515479 /ORGANISM="Licmophora paradoxa, Strain CCMP2313" /LENGTH=68 /DNA_ID=CAMNT_0049091805 /DNA_START=224 /DNA_END=426 /DNA_ORIENTATION=-
MIIGAVCTHYLDKIGFENLVVEFVRQYNYNYNYDYNWTEEEEEQRNNDDGEFYSSMVVMAVTGIWSYV